MLQATVIGLGALGDEVATVLFCAAGAFVVALFLCLRRPRRRVDLEVESGDYDDRLAPRHAGRTGPPLKETSNVRSF